MDPLLRVRLRPWLHPLKWSYEGLMDTFCGLKKNAYAGMRCNPFIAILTTLVIVLTGVFVPLYLIFAIMALAFQPTTVWAVALILALVVNILFFSHFERRAGLRQGGVGR